MDVLLSFNKNEELRHIHKVQSLFQTELNTFMWGKKFFWECLLLRNVLIYSSLSIEVYCGGLDIREILHSS